MLALVPLINVPFDWLSIGFTRALLRRGCERGAPSPLWLGLFDLGIGIVLMLLLACALVLALQTADWLTDVPGQPPLIDVPARLLTLYRTPIAPENWWIYITLFSTLLPSALNGMIGMASLATWIAPARHRERLIRRIERLQPEDGSRRFDATVHLMAPVFIGTVLAGLVAWGAFAAILYGASYLLGAFLLLATSFEWVLFVTFGS